MQFDVSVSRIYSLTGAGPGCVRRTRRSAALALAALLVEAHRYALAQSAKVLQRALDPGQQRLRQSARP
jgi:hypothetical protein